jgi:flagellin-like hook-associated protein FlgL
MGQANRTESALRGQAGRLRRLRDIAQQGTDRQLPTEARRSLTARFEALLNRIADAASAPEETADPAAAAAPAIAPEETADPIPNETATAPVADTPPGISITGETIVRGARIREEETGLAESAVAQDRGLADVQVAETEDQVRFTFRDLGEGRIQATRFERTEQGMVETGTQTVAAPDARAGRVAEGQTAALNFDRLGLQIELDENYTAGDLQELEITSAPATAESGAAATEPPSQQLTVDEPEAAQAAYNRIDQVLADMARVRDDLRQQREAESDNALRALADYGNQEDISALADAETAGTLTDTLRTQILEQAAGAVTAQGEISTDRLLLLLG